MTSAQCAKIFKECDGEVIEAVVGAWNLTNPQEILEHQQRIPVKEVRVASRYSGQPPPYLDDDFAFVLLNHSVILNERVRPLKLRLTYRYDAFSSSSSSSASNNTSSTPGDHICKMISWGNHYLNKTFEKSESVGSTTTTERKTYPDVLQQEDLLMIGNIECYHLIGKINPIHDNMLCGVKLPFRPNSTIDCDGPHLIWKPTGDTGSALICSGGNGDSYLAGLTSWENMPCTGKHTDRIIVFTRIDQYVQPYFHVPA